MMVGRMGFFHILPVPLFEKKVYCRKTYEAIYQESAMTINGGVLS